MGVEDRYVLMVNETQWEALKLDDKPEALDQIVDLKQAFDQFQDQMAERPWQFEKVKESLMPVISASKALGISLEGIECVHEKTYHKDPLGHLLVKLQHYASFESQDLQEELFKKEELLEMLGVLMSHGYDMTFKGLNEEGIQHVLAHQGNVWILNELMKKGAALDLSAPSQFGFTPLHLATLSKFYDVMSYLLVQGVNIEQEDRYGWTALHHAASHGDVKGMQVLLEAGAQRYRRAMPSNSTILELSMNSGKMEAVTYLIEQERFEPTQITQMHVETFCIGNNAISPDHQQIRTYMTGVLMVLEEKKTLEKQQLSSIDPNAPVSGSPHRIHKAL